MWTTQLRLRPLVLLLLTLALPALGCSSDAKTTDTSDSAGSADDTGVTDTADGSAADTTSDTTVDGSGTATGLARRKLKSLYASNGSRLPL